MTPLLLPVSQQACQPESTDQSPVSASQPPKPAWQWAIINTHGECYPSSFGLNITYVGRRRPQPHQASFVFKEFLSPGWKMRAWYKCAGWKNLMGTGMRQLILNSRADRADYSESCVKTLTTEQCCCQGWRGLLGVGWGVTDKNQHLSSIMVLIMKTKKKSI